MADGSYGAKKMEEMKEEERRKIEEKQEMEMAEKRKKEEEEKRLAEEEAGVNLVAKQLKGGAFVDDPKVYRRKDIVPHSHLRADWQERVDYLHAQRKKRRKDRDMEIGADDPNFEPWIATSGADAKSTKAEDLERMLTPKWKTFALRFLSSVRWDYIYMYSIVLWCIVYALSVDGFFPPFLGITPEATALLFVFPLISALIPFVGGIIMKIRSDRITLLFMKRDLSSWSVVFVLSMKAVETIAAVRFLCMDPGVKVEPEEKEEVVEEDRNKSVLQSAHGSRKKRVVGKQRKSVEAQDMEEKREAAERVRKAREDSTADDEEFAEVEEEVEVDSDEEDDGKKKKGGPRGKRAKAAAAAAAAKKGGGKQGEAPKKKSRRRKQKKVVKLRTWHCVVCGVKNKAPEDFHQERNVLTVREIGHFVKRHVVGVSIQFPGARCKACDTPWNYVPRHGTAHMFEHYPERHKAFSNYPAEDLAAKRMTGAAGCKLCLNRWRNIIFGIYGKIDAPVLAYDWRLQPYLRKHIPDVPRDWIEKGKDRYMVSEPVECRLQKPVWSPAVILNVRRNGTYDIRYESGEELRFVAHHKLRMPPRCVPALIPLTELNVLFFALLYPLLALVAVATASPALLPVMAVPMLLFAVQGLVYWWVRFCAAYRKYWEVGCLQHFRFLMFYSSPFFCLLLFCLTILAGGPPILAFFVFIVAKWLAVIQLYMMMPIYGKMGAGLNCCWSAFDIVYAIYATFPDLFPVFIAVMGPVLICFAILIYLRGILRHLWTPKLRALDIRHPASQEKLLNLVPPRGIDGTSTGDGSDTTDTRTVTTDADQQSNAGAGLKDAQNALEGEGDEEEDGDGGGGKDKKNKKQKSGWGFGKKDNKKSAKVQDTKENEDAVKAAKARKKREAMEDKV